MSRAYQVADVLDAVMGDVDHEEHLARVQGLVVAPELGVRDARREHAGDPDTEARPEQREQEDRAQPECRFHRGDTRDHETEEGAERPTEDQAGPDPMFEVTLLGDGGLREVSQIGPAFGHEMHVPVLDAGQQQLPLDLLRRLDTREHKN